MVPTRPNFAELADDLSELVGETVRIEGGEQRQMGGSTLSIIEMGYTRRTSTGDGPASTTHIRQTALVSKDPELDLPQFALSPTPKGIGGALLLSLLGGMGDINFDDSPKFSQEYHLHGWSEHPVRLLFTRAIRDHFADNLGWGVLGRNNVLVVFHHNQVFDGSERESFVGDALTAMTLFQQAEEHLDSMPEVRRETTASDVTATAKRMGGLVGAMLAKQMKKLSVTPLQLENFLAESQPRTIPPGIKQQVVGRGDNFVLVVFGAIFVIAGLVAGSMVVGLSEGNQRFIGLPLMIVFPLIGGCMMFFTLRHRIRRKRTLKRGMIARARVAGVERTSTEVNNQRRYHVIVEFSHGGEKRVASLHAYGPAVDRAREFQESGNPMRVLVDPKDSDHLVGIDLLMMFDG